MRETIRENVHFTIYRARKITLIAMKLPKGKCKFFFCTRILNLEKKKKEEKRKNKKKEN